MKQSYVLDFDGLEGIYEFGAPASVQVEIEKVHVNHVNAESSDSSNIHGVHKFPIKKHNSLFPKVAVLMIGLVGYLSFISLHDEKSDIEPLSKQIVRDSGGTVIPTESESQSSEAQNRVPESEYSKTHNTIKYPNGKSRTDEVGKKHPVLAGLEAKFSVPVESVQKQDSSHSEDSKAVTNEKFKVRAEIDSKQKVKHQPKHSNNAVSSNSDAATRAQTKTNLLSGLRQNSGKSAADFVLQFSFNESTVANLPSAKLLHLKTVAQSCPDGIQVVGHTCNLGSFLSNQAVGLVRATWVKDLLVKIGLSADRIRVVSAGHNKPVASNNTFAGRALNRRVTVECVNNSDKIKEEIR